MRRASGSVIPLRSSSSSIPALLHDTPTYWPQYTVPGFLRRYMFCPYCGTKTTTNDAHFCYECGSDIKAPNPERTHDTEDEPRERRDQQRAAAGSVGAMMQRGIPSNHTARTLLSVVGLLAVLLLAIPLLVGVALIGLFTGVALLGVLLKLAPAILIGLVLYWVLAERRGRRHAPWHSR